MGFLSKENIFNARDYISAHVSKPDTFAGFILLLLCAEKNKKDPFYKIINMKLFSEMADLSFKLSEDNYHYSEKLWYVLFSKNWIKQAKEFFLRNERISLNKFLATLFWYKGFDNESKMLQEFKEQINNDEFISELFFIESSSISFDTLEPYTREAFFNELNGEKDSVSIKYDKKFIKKRAGDISASVFSQTLYAGLEIKKIFTIFDYDIIASFSFPSLDTAFPRKIELQYSKYESLSKPFLILAGISGTGKTRFVRQQAELTGKNNYCLVSVRPDWHEPSDLLGYISHLGSKPKYITTDVLRFIVQAWKHIADSGFDLKTGKVTEEQLNKIQPYWLCLDEMNLAPVEQYFADYLSILETRQWSGEVYQCDPLLKSSVLENIQPADFGLDEGDILWGHFKENGISIPFNLIVAGTVNMDETTHGFSRKVLDRALSFDFNEFYPNDFNAYFSPNAQNKTFTYSIYSNANLSLNFDSPFVKESCEFLSEVNGVLKNSPFELAYRALNELLLSVKCINPKNEIELQSIWDDFLMMKVLPRIEGDSEKLDFDGEKSLLTNLEAIIKEQLSAIWNDDKRIDLFRETNEGDVINMECRSKAKIRWMQTKLEKFGFTHFWK